MKRWEYLILDSKDVASRGLLAGTERLDIDAYLNELGDRGGSWSISTLGHVGGLVQPRFSARVSTGQVGDVGGVVVLLHHHGADAGGCVPAD